MSWLKPGKDYDFMGLRRYFLGASLLLMVVSVVAFFKPGPRFGTDFVGGTELELAFKKPVTGGQVRSAVQKLGFKSPDVVEVSDDKNPHRFLIRVKEVSALSDAQKTSIAKALCEVEEGEEAKLDQKACPKELRSSEVKFSPGGDKVAVRFLTDPCKADSGEGACPPRENIAQLLSGAKLKKVGIELRTGRNNPSVQSRRDFRVEFYFKSKGEQIMDGLRKQLGDEAVPATAMRVEWIGPKAGRQLRDAAIKSILIAIIFIMAYIAFRFDMRFAPGSIAALVHDVFLAMGVMVLAQREVTLSTVAALLTIVGYSINDTVVVYDRIRENLGRYRKMTFPKIINRSVTEMLGRTVRTSGLTAAAMIPFLFWGTGVIKDFAFTLLVGVIVGTYSSIYIASPLTELIDRYVFSKAVKKKKRRVRRKKKKGPGSQRAPASV